MMINLNSVTIPECITISREFNYNSKKRNENSLDKYIISQYDFKTIFYDVFFDPNNQYLYAIGPPFLNLTKDLDPIKLFINKNIIKFKISDYLKNWTAILQSERIDRYIKDENLVELDFRGLFQWSCLIRKNTLLSNANLTLCTMQKDNRIIWIKDWIKYYKKNFNVDRIILYDNNSRYQSLLDNEISDTIIVKWNFRFGLHKKGFIYNYSEIAYRNHCRLRFGNRNYGLYFDIDELLVLNNKDLLNLVHGKSIVYFDSYMVPYSKPENVSYSYKDFYFRRIYNRIVASKYIFKFEDINLNNVHYCEKKIHTNYIVGLFIRILYETRIFLLFANLSNKIAIVKPLLSIILAVIEFIFSSLGIYFVPLDKGYFLHYVGITTNWKFKSGSNWNRLSSKKFSPRKHVKDMPSFDDN